MLFKKLTEPEGPHVSVVTAADLEAIEPDLNERHEACSSRNKPSPVLRQMTSTQNTTPDRITLNFNGHKTNYN